MIEIVILLWVRAVRERTWEVKREGFVTCKGIVPLRGYSLSKFGFIHVGAANCGAECSQANEINRCLPRFNLTHAFEIRLHVICPW